MPPASKSAAPKLEPKLKPAEGFKLPMIGQPVVFFDQGKVEHDRAVPATIVHLEMSRDDRVSVEVTHGHRGQRDGVFHVSALNDSEIPAEQIRDCGLWAHLDECRKMHDIEVDRQAKRRSQQLEQQQKRDRHRQNLERARTMLAGGASIEAVSAATEIPKENLRELLETA